MTIGELQDFMESVRRRSRLTPEEWSKIELQITVYPNAEPKDLRFNLNISDLCVDRLNVWNNGGR